MFARASQPDPPSRLPRVAPLRPRAPLVVRPAADAHEREADRLAGALLLDSLLAPGKTAHPASIQRELEDPSQGGAPVPDALAAQVHGLHSGGQPLRAADRAFFEQRLGFDFSRVRVHVGGEAASAARGLAAHAFTFGHHIGFAPGRYAPERPAGRMLLAHELVHVAQQAGGGATCARIQRQPEGVPYEKYAEEIERQYRLRGNLATASAILSCRTQGASFCDRILTANQWSALYRMSSDARGDKNKLKTALSLSGPAFLRISTALETATATATATTTGAAAGGGAGGLGAGATVVAPAVILAGILVIAGVELWALGQFQTALRRQGFILLDEPLGLCIGGCHLPAAATARPLLPLRPTLAPDPTPLIDWIRKRETRVDQQPRRRPPFVLRLPREKAHQLWTYRSWLGTIESDPSYTRPPTRQVDKWDQAIRPTGSHGMWPQVYRRAVGLGLTNDRIFRPDWSRTRSIPFEVDHVVEMQVVPRAIWQDFDSMNNYELLDRTANGAAGPRMSAAIAGERAVQAAYDPTSTLRVLKFDAVELGGGQQGERWTSDEIQRGDHVDDYARTH